MNGNVKQEGEASAMAQQGMVDPIDSLLDLSDYDNVQQYDSPSMSPATSKRSFIRSTAASTPASLLSTSQPMTGPSHQYDQYKQQTGFVPGALANTFAVNQNNAHVAAAGYGNFDMNFMNMGNNSDDVFDFNTAPNNASVSPSDMGLDFDSPAADPNFFFPDTNGAAPAPMNNMMAGQESLATPPVLAANGAPQNGHVGRLWPGMHQQAALAKAQAQQRQQQQIIQQQQRQRQNVAQVPVKQQPQAPRHKPTQPSDPIVEQKITQLLNSMRAKPSPPPNGNGAPMVNISRPRKDEEDMDDDERLLASEEGKKLTSKERRQLRNKVSARAFRSRRKEYISQLESEIANKVTENGDLRTQNRVLVEENKRLSDLTRMLLSSPSFSDFLDRLSSNPSLLPQNQPQAVSQPEQQQQQQQQQERQAPKDVNPYSAQQQIGVAMIPEQNIDLSMLQIDSEPAFAFQPQVYAVLETPDVSVASIDASILSGKTSNFVGCHMDEEEKIDMPVIHHPVSEKKDSVKAVAVGPVDEEFENDPVFALYHDAEVAAPVATEASAERCTPVELSTEVTSDVDIFGGVETEKALARYELVDASEEVIREVNDSIAVARITQIASNLKAIAARLDMLNPEC